MEDFFEKFTFLIVEIIIGSIIVGLLISFVIGIVKENEIFEKFISESIDCEIRTKYELSPIEDIEFIVENSILEIGDLFIWENFVSVYDFSNNNLIERVHVSGEVDTSIPGIYEIFYTLEFQSQTIVKKGIYYVS